MGLDNKQFDELIGEDLFCEVGSEHELRSGSARDRMVRNCSAKQVVRLPFVFDISKGWMEDGVLCLADLPEYPFKGEALLLWGISWQTRIHSLRSGNTEALCRNHTPVPGILYDCPGVPGETVDKIKLGQFVPNFYQCVDMITADHGMQISLKISGPVTHAVLMGKGLANA